MNKKIAFFAVKIPPKNREIDSLTQAVIYFRFIDREKLAYYHIAIDELIQK